MLQQLKLASTIGALALLMTVSAGAFAAPASDIDIQQLGKMFFTERMMKTMDKNKDGMVSRQEFMDYVMIAFDNMDQNKDKMLDKKEFMDSKMMQTAFPAFAN